MANITTIQSTDAIKDSRATINTNFSNLNNDKVESSQVVMQTALDTDGTLAANSDVKVATQKATKTYADTKIASSALDTDGTLTANSDVKVPSQKAVKTYADTKVPTSYLDTDGTLAANSDSKVATQKAIKTYVDDVAQSGGTNASESVKGISEEATQAETDAGTATGGTGAKLFVTPAKLAASSLLTQQTILNPIGIVSPYAGATAPTGWLLCDGSAVSRTTYSALFAIVSTTYGSGDGSSTFNLPNLKGKIPVGKNAAEEEFDTLGETGGEKTHQLTVAELAAHTHSTGTCLTPGQENISWGTGSTHNVTTVTGSAGSNSAHNNLQPYITLNYIIKY